MTTQPAFGSLLEILTLETLEESLFRSTFLFSEKYPLYGGQVAAQALIAAGKTVPDSRQPHSIHGYFLRGGDPSIPVVFKVEKDFDGGSFSSRRVIAIQRGEVIFNASVSFHLQHDGPDDQMVDAKQVGAPEALHDWPSGRLHSIEMKTDRPHKEREHWPTDFKARISADLPDDPLMHAAGLAYLTDAGTGLRDAMTPEIGFLASIDHSIWIHSIPDITKWHLFNLEPRRIGSGRGLFTGAVFDDTGSLVASFAQESLFRYKKRPTA